MTSSSLIVVSFSLSLGVLLKMFHFEWVNLSGKSQFERLPASETSSSQCNSCSSSFLPHLSSHRAVLIVKCHVQDRIY